MLNRYLTLIFVALVFLACDDDVSYVYPSLPGQFISYEVEGQEQVLRGLVSTDRTANSLSYQGANPGINQLHLSRGEGTGDAVTILTLRAENLPLEKTARGVRYTGDNDTPATVVIESTVMSGSVYCPHEEEMEAIRYDAQVSFEEATDGGVLRGSFFTKIPAGEGLPSLQSGNFEVRVDLVEQR